MKGTQEIMEQLQGKNGSLYERCVIFKGTKESVTEEWMDG